MLEDAEGLGVVLRTCSRPASRLILRLCTTFNTGTWRVSTTTTVETCERSSGQIVGVGNQTRDQGNEEECLCI